MDGSHEPAAGATPYGGPEHPPPAPRLLRRTTEDRMIVGVAGGLGRYLGIDPIAVRIGFVVLTVFGGSGVLLYLVGLVAIPEEQPGEPVGVAAPRRGGGGQGAAIAIGGALVAVGAFSLVGQLVPGVRDLAGPLLLLTAGALVILWGGRR